MRVEAIFDDAVSNLVDEQIDLGIRVGWLTDSSNQARRLGTIRQVVVASPAFAASLPADANPNQARSLAWVGNAQLRGVGQWLFSRNGETVLTELNPVVVCDKSPAAYACVLAGIGLGIFPDYAVDEDIAQGGSCGYSPSGPCPPEVSMPSFRRPASGPPRCAPSLNCSRLPRESGRAAPPKRRSVTRRATSVPRLTLISKWLCLR